MSDTHAPVADFSAVEVEQFDADDATAGRAIGKLLSVLFLYTVLAMSLVIWWTFGSVATRPDATQSDATQSDATQSDATQSDATRPDATQSDATQSGDGHAHETSSH
jgi:cytoskeletal protein RodZ